MPSLSPPERDARALWYDVFGDSPESVASFFDLVYRADEALLAYDDEVLASMLLYPRFDLRPTGGMRLPVGYLCGIATHPDYRGKGFSGALLHKALRRERRRGDVFSTLIPAEPSLFDFYERKANFFPAFSEAITTDEQEFLARSTYRMLRAPSIEHFLAHYEELDDIPQLLHSPSWWKVALEDYRLSEGYQLLVQRNNRGQVEGVAFVMVLSEKEVWIRATFGAKDVQIALLAEIRSTHPQASIRYYLPTPPDQSPRPKGMARLLNVGLLLRHHLALHPEANLSFAYRDTLFPEEDGRYEVREGHLIQRPLQAGDLPLTQAEVLALLGLSPLRWRAYLLTEGEL